MSIRSEYIDKLAKEWARCGVNQGDLLLVHINIKRTLINARQHGVPLLPDDVLDSFIESLGSSGTLYSHYLILNLQLQKYLILGILVHKWVQ